MLGVLYKPFILSVIILSVKILNVVMLNVVALFEWCGGATSNALLLNDFLSNDVYVAIPLVMTSMSNDVYVA
jgi:hypothetical protein